MKTSGFYVGLLGGLLAYSSAGMAESQFDSEAWDVEQPVIETEQIIALLKDGHIPAPLEPGPGDLGRDDLAPAPLGRPNASYHHPGGHNTNRPPYGWYNADYSELYNLYTSSSELRTWAYNYNHYEIWYFADWLYESVRRHSDNTYYRHYYDNNRYDWRPRHYSSWNYYATRGDHNYYFYYYARPIYFQILREAKKYVIHHGYGGKYYEYRYIMKRFVSGYHGYTRCNYGANGDDMDALVDTAAFAFEQDALGSFDS